MTYNLQPTTINKFKMWLFFSLIVGCLFLIVGQVSAQTAPEFLVSWRALNYVPAHYHGKILPSNSTPVEIGFDLVDQNRIANISQNEISWSTNGRTAGSGIGLKNMKMIAGGLDQTIRITIFDYKGADLDKIFTIPSARPEIIINAKTTGKTIGIGDQLFSAMPFFFNIKNLNELLFSWTINGQSAAGSPENPHILNLNLSSEDTPQETELIINLLARKANNDLEFGGKKLNLIVR